MNFYTIEMLNTIKNKYNLKKIKDNNKYIIVKIDESEISKVKYSDIIALYKDSNESKINVGFPYIQSYCPMAANMYGFKNANQKELYLICDNYEYSLDVIKDKDLYMLEIDENKTVVLLEKIIKDYNKTNITQINRKLK